MEKFKYGPLVWNSGSDDDDEGNYYWGGQPPVGYDSMNVPVDIDGRQCLPMDCPFHPHHRFSDEIRSRVDSSVTYPNSFKDYEEWLEKNFIVFDENPVKRNIMMKVIQQASKNNNGQTNMHKLIRLIINEIENHYGKPFTEKGMKQEEKLSADT